MLADKNQSSHRSIGDSWPLKIPSFEHFQRPSYPFRQWFWFIQSTVSNLFIIVEDLTAGLDIGVWCYGLCPPPPRFKIAPGLMWIQRKQWFCFICVLTGAKPVNRWAKPKVTKSLSTLFSVKVVPSTRIDQEMLEVVGEVVWSLPELVSIWEGHSCKLCDSSAMEVERGRCGGDWSITVDGKMGNAEMTAGEKE